MERICLHCLAEDWCAPAVAYLDIAEDRSAVEGKITAGRAGQVHPVWKSWGNYSDCLDPAYQVIDINGVINLK